MRPLRVLVLAALLAGCSAPGQVDGGDGDGEGPADGLPVPRFGAPVDLSQGRGGGPEPIVAVTDDGWTYVAAQDGKGGPPWFWATQDGRTWRSARPSQQSGGEVDMAWGPRGMVYYTQLGPQGNVVSVSRDRGQTWTTTPIQALTTQYFDREWVAVDPQGSAFIVARQFGSLGQDTWAQSSRSDDNGITFVAQGRVWDATREPGGGNGNLVWHAGGLLIPYVCRDVQGVCAATSRDRAQSWTQSLVVERSVRTDNVYPVAAADGSRLLVTWSDASDGRLAVWVASSTDGGRSWSRPWKASDAAESATMPWLATGGGRVWLAYLSTPAVLEAADEPAARGAVWTPVAARLDAGAQAVTERGPVMGPVHEGIMSKPVGQSGQQLDRSFGDFFTAAVDRQGKLVVAIVQTMDGRSDTLLVTQA